MPPPASRQQKSAETRARILEAALELFRERGFAEAPMREIASRAGVAMGLAYYYFASKDAIVLAFYQQALEELGPLLDAAQSSRKLETRLGALIEAKLGYFAPNRRFLGALMAHAADPGSQLSPFSEPSRGIREFDFAHFARALEETGTAVPDDLAPHLPRILWMYQMGILLFWIYDRSEEQERSRRLLAASLKMVAQMIRLARLPLLRPARKMVIELVGIVEGRI